MPGKASSTPALRNHIGQTNVVHRRPQSDMELVGY